MINDLLEAHSTKSIENNPRLTLSEVFALSAELLYDEMHDITETLEMGVGLPSNLITKVGVEDGLRRDDRSNGGTGSKIREFLCLDWWI